MLNYNLLNFLIGELIVFVLICVCAVVYHTLDKMFPNKSKEEK